MTGDSPLRVVVMGVSAAGKSTVARRLASELDAHYIDADELHSKANVDRMSRGLPLTDDDRWPWLDAVGAALAAAGPQGIVLACSALRRVYRDRLRATAPGVVFIHLHGAPQVIRDRAASRAGHFMPPELLDSQLATLELLSDDETGVQMDIDASVGAIARASREWLQSITDESKMTGAV